MRKCKIHICPRPSKSTGYCATHYAQMYVHGKITKEDIGEMVSRGVVYKKRNVGKCSMPDCLRSQKVSNMCVFHYQKSYRKKTKEQVWRSIKQFNSSQTSTFSSRD